MKIEIAENSLIARAEGNEKFKNESALYSAIKNAVNKKGYNVIKKCPAKDRHMTGAPYYIRDKKNQYCYIDNDYAIRDLAEDFNNKQVIQLKFANLKEE